MNQFRTNLTKIPVRPVVYLLGIFAAVKNCQVMRIQINSSSCVTSATFFQQLSLTAVPTLCLLQRIVENFLFFTSMHLELSLVAVSPHRPGM